MFVKEYLEKISGTTAVDKEPKMVIGAVIGIIRSFKVCLQLVWTFEYHDCHGLGNLWAVRELQARKSSYLVLHGNKIGSERNRARYQLGMAYALVEDSMEGANLVDKVVWNDMITWTNNCWEKFRLNEVRQTLFQMQQSKQRI